MSERFKLAFRPEDGVVEEEHHSYGGSAIQLSVRRKLISVGRSSDLRPYSSPEQDQRDFNACTTNAMVKARETLRIKRYGRAAHIDLSRMAPYYLGRELMTPCEVDRDDGTYLSAVAEVFRRFGMCSEQEWAYTEEHLWVPPTWMAMRKAKLNTISSWAKIRTVGMKRVDDVIEALRGGIPVPFGTKCGNAWYNHKPGQVLQRLGDDFDGYHATTLMAWDDASGYFIGENSWKDWGEYYEDGAPSGEPIRRGFYYIDPSVIAAPESTDFIVMSDDPEILI